MSYSRRAINYRPSHLLAIGLLGLAPPSELQSGYAPLSLLVECNAGVLSLSLSLSLCVTASRISPLPLPIPDCVLFHAGLQSEGSASPLK